MFLQKDSAGCDQCEIIYRSLAHCQDEQREKPRRIPVDRSVAGRLRIHHVESSVAELQLSFGTFRDKIDNSQ